MSKKVQNKFNFQIPMQKIEKSKGADGKEIMKFKGICSSKTEDSDGETLHPDGFDFQPLMEKGFINYNHQAGKSSGTIVGRPTKCEVINGGDALYLEGILYPEVDEAQKIYKLAKALENDPTGRHLSFSIEGNATQRDPFNPKKVLKATITDVAICHKPKNSNTFMQIMKGEQEQDFVTTNGEDEESGEINQPIEGEDETEKALTAETVTNTFGVPDIEGTPKKLLAKSEIYKSLISKYDIDNIEKAKEIYTFIDTVNTKLYNNMEGITSEALVKAFEFLDTQITKSEEVEIVKAEGGVQDDNQGTEDEIEASKKKEEMEKSKEFAVENLKKGMSKDENIEDCIRKGISLSESQTAVESAISEYEAGEKEGGTITAVVDPTISLQLAEVSKTVAELTKAIEALTTKDTLQKAEGEEVENTLTTLLKAQNDGLNDRFSSMGVILKSVFENSELLKASVEELTAENEELKTTVNAIAKSSDGPKSVQRVTAKPVDRFMKSEGSGQEGSMTYQLSDKASCGALTDRLFADYTLQKSKGIDDSELKKGIENIEFTKTLTPAFQARLEKQGINVVR